MKLPFLIVMLVCFTHVSYAGRLDDFEDVVTEKPSLVAPAHSSRYHDHDDNEYWDAALVEAMYTIIVFGGRHSHLRMQAEPYTFGESTDGRDDWNFPVKRRVPGDPMLPILKLEAGYWYQDSDLYATTTRFEAGYGCIGFQANNSFFRESDPTDSMNLFSWHLLYRMSFSQYLEVGFGLGAASLTGDNENSGSSITWPIRMHTDYNWGIEYKPEWININGFRVADYDLGFYYDFKHGSVIAGYRWWETKTSNLEGPYIGFAIRF